MHPEAAKIREKAWGGTVLPLYRVARWAGQTWGQVAWDTYAPLWKIPRQVLEDDLEAAFYAAASPETEPLTRQTKPVLFFPPIEDADYSEAAGGLTIWLQSGHSIVVATGPAAIYAEYWIGREVHWPHDWRGADIGIRAKLAVVKAVAEEGGMALATELLQEYAAEDGLAVLAPDEAEELVKNAFNDDGLVGQGR